jgi:hypothetical protein
MITLIESCKALSFNVYKRCSICPPPFRTHAWARRTHDWWIRSNTKLSSRITWKAFWTRSHRSSASFTGVAQTTVFKWPHRYKSNKVRSGDLGGEDTGPPRPIHSSWNRSLRCRGGSSLGADGAQPHSNLIILCYQMISFYIILIWTSDVSGNDFVVN